MSEGKTKVCAYCRMIIPWDNYLGVSSAGINPVWVRSLCNVCFADPAALAFAQSGRGREEVK